METLLALAEAGHYDSVKHAFAFPFKNCPDILVFALLQTKVGCILNRLSKADK